MEDGEAPGRAEIFALPFCAFCAFCGYFLSRLFQARNRLIIGRRREPTAPGGGSCRAIKNDGIRAGRKRGSGRILPAVKANGAPDTFKELVLFAR